MRLGSDSNPDPIWKKGEGEGGGGKGRKRKGEEEEGRRCKSHFFFLTSKKFELKILIRSGFANLVKSREKEEEEEERREEEDAGAGGKKMGRRERI